MPLLTRSDNFAPPKRAQCNTGEPCGSTCIDPNEACRVEMSPQMRSQIEGLRSSLLNSVPGVAQLNTARGVIKDFAQIRKAGDRGQQAMYLGALLVGTSLLAYSKYKEKYREGFANSAEVALRRSKGMSSRVPDIGGKENIIFAVDSSLSKGDKGRGGGLADELQQDAGFAAKYHVVSIKQNAHDTPTDLDGLSPRDKRIAEVMVPLKQAVMNARNGQSDAAVDLASQILAYNAKHGVRTETSEVTYYDQGAGRHKTRTETKQVPTNLQINLLGHGDGGMVASEAMEILKRVPGGTELAHRINVIGLNTPDAGLTDPVGKVKTIASRNSPAMVLPMKNKVTMDAPDGEGGRAMLRKQAVRDFIDGHFGGVAPISSAAAPRATEPKPEAPKAPTSGAPRTTQASPPAPTKTASTFTATQPSILKTTDLGTSSSTKAFKPAELKSSLVREILKTNVDLMSADEIRNNYPQLNAKQAYDVSTVGGLPLRLRNEYIEGKMNLATAIEIGREIAWDDRQKKAYMQHLIRLRRQKPEASIDARDYRLALERLIDPSFRGDSKGRLLQMRRDVNDVLSRLTKSMPKSLSSVA